MRRFACFLCLMAVICLSVAQTGGSAAFQILSLPQSARTAALGGSLVSVREETDPALSIANPSLLQEKMGKNISALFVDYFADAFYGNVHYFHANRWGVFRAGVQAVSYGAFDGYDLYGNETGSFSAGDYVISLGYGRELVPDRISLGMNLKTVFSYYETYFSAALALDAAASYYDDEKNLCMSLAAVNIGAQFVSYADEREALPFDLQFAVSRKLEHLPARFHFMFHHLTRWNMQYDDPTDPYLEYNSLTGENQKRSGVEVFMDNAFRHFVLGLEIEPVNVLSLQFSYDYNRRKEMRLYNRPALAGVSYGVCLHIRQFNLQYARVHAHVSSVPNFISVSINLNQFKKS